MAVKNKVAMDFRDPQVQWPRVNQAILKILSDYKDGLKRISTEFLSLQANLSQLICSNALAKTNGVKNQSN